MWWTLTRPLCALRAPFHDRFACHSLCSKKSEQRDNFNTKVPASFTFLEMSIIHNIVRRSSKCYCDIWEFPFSSTKGQCIDLSARKREEKGLKRAYVSWDVNFLFHFTCARSTRVQYDMMSELTICGRQLVFEGRKRVWESVTAFPCGSSSWTGHYKETENTVLFVPTILNFCACAIIVLHFSTEHHEELRPSETSGMFIDVRDYRMFDIFLNIWYKNIK